MNFDTWMAIFGVVVGAAIGLLMLAVAARDKEGRG